MSVASDTAQALFAPRSIALIGASADENKHASLPQRYLRRHGYSGEIFPVNPTRDTVLGERAYSNVCAIGRPVDHAFVMLPTGAVRNAVIECGRAGVRCATILSNGFAESGEEGRRRQEELVSIAHDSGMRLLGPNSLGVINLQDGIALSANEVLSLPELRPGRYGLVSQSGSLIGALLSRGQARGIGFSKLVSVGNESDLGVAEIGTMLVEDEGTDAIMLFLETIRDAAGLVSMARRAFAVGKPVIAFRLGRSDVGEKLAASHTGALTANGAALDAFLSDIGCVRVEMFESLLETPPLFVGQKPASAKRVAVVTTTGGGGALVIDKLAPGIEVVPPSDAVVASLAAQGITIAQTPLIDLTLTGTNAKTYGPVLDALLASDHCDAVISVVGSSSQFRADRAVAPIVEAVGKHRHKPLAVFLTPQADTSLALLSNAGIAAFRTPEACADAISAYFTWRAPRSLDRGTAPEAAVKAMKAARSASLDAVEASKVFEALGVPQARDRILADVDAIDDAALADMRFPVVAKILSRDIAHKTELGGVVTGIRSAADLRTACTDILARVRKHAPDARIDGIQVQEMERGLAEVLLGYRYDPTVGPTITLGVGGVLAEIYRDHATRMAPVDEAEAATMVAELRGLAPIRGYRGLPRGDVAALARAIAAVSRLALIDSPRISEAEINPLIVRAEGQGVVAVDGVILCEEA